MRARSDYQVHQADEVILLNERGEVCEGTITSIFADPGDDVLVTPALTSGLLPGVLRAELLDTARAHEAVLGPADLMDAKNLFVGNSLRGLIPARLAG
jgi:4-amino-4-deoxychorismate lyase